MLRHCWLPQCQALDEASTGFSPSRRASNFSRRCGSARASMVAAAFTLRVCASRYMTVKACRCWRRGLRGVHSPAAWLTLIRFPTLMAARQARAGADPEAQIYAALCDGAAGVVITMQRRPLALMAFTVTGGKIAESTPSATPLRANSARQFSPGSSLECENRVSRVANRSMSRSRA